MNAATCGDKPNPGCRFAHPGYACCAKALGITIKHHESSLARPPIDLQARPSKPDIIADVRVGITKAVDL